MFVENPGYLALLIGACVAFAAVLIYVDVSSAPQRKKALEEAARK